MTRRSLRASRVVCVCFLPGALSSSRKGQCCFHVLPSCETLTASVVLTLQRSCRLQSSTDNPGDRCPGGAIQCELCLTESSPSGNETDIRRPCQVPEVKQRYIPKSCGGGADYDKFSCHGQRLMFNTSSSPGEALTVCPAVNVLSYSSCDRSPS